MAHAGGMNEATERAPLYRRIVVGVDGSSQAAAALGHAWQLAEATGAELVVVAAWTYPPVFTGYTDSIDPEADAWAVLDQALTGRFDGAVPEEISKKTVPGPAAAALIEESKDADLLVVGSRGHGGFSGLLLGSVSAQCAEHAHCPVLVHH
jgi:nucleotide-binding universal stress UspA family protein